MKKNDISIGITAYREGSWLQECWESVEAQTYPDWEAIMVLDGGANDATRSIFEGIEHPNLKKITLEQNMGPYLCRTQAILNSSSAWYVHLDGDDRLPPNAIQLIQDAISAFPEANFVYGDCLYFDDSKDSEILAIEKFCEDNLVEGLLKTITGPSPVRKDLFNTVGGFADELQRGGADWDFWIGVVEAGGIGSRADGIIYEHRMRANSNSKSWQLKRDVITKLIVDRHPIYFSQGDRQNQVWSNTYAKMARYYRAFDRKQAAIFAQKAQNLSNRLPVLDEIIKESRMSPFRYFLRRFANKVVTKFSWALPRFY